MADHYYLREWRTNYPLSQEELAAKSGVRQSTISEIENQPTGRNRQGRVIRALAEALDITPADLKKLPPKGEPERVVQFTRRLGDKPLSEQGEEIVRLAVELDKTERKLAKSEEEREALKAELEQVKAQLSDIIEKIGQIPQRGEPDTGPGNASERRAPTP